VLFSEKKSLFITMVLKKRQIYYTKMERILILKRSGTQKNHWIWKQYDTLKKKSWVIYAYLITF
jgi:hypothetical protein